MRVKCLAKHNTAEKRITTSCYKDPNGYISLMFCMYKPFKSGRTKCQTGPKFGEYEPWDIRPCTLGEVSFLSANKTCFLKYSWVGLVKMKIFCTAFWPMLTKR